MLFGIEKGILCRQVNCQGLSDGEYLNIKIDIEYPIVKEKYKEACKNKLQNELFGKIQLVPVSDDLLIANLFTKLKSGYAYKDPAFLTDTGKLISAIDKIAERYSDKEIFIPAYLGCGKDGGNWNEISGKLFSLERPNLYLLDTKSEPYLRTKLYIPQLSLRDDYPLNIDTALYRDKILAFDTETTGVSNYDEILQLSIVNEDEDIVLSSYFKPEKHNSWNKAMEVNHITPKMVENAPLIRHYRALLQKIFTEANTVVAHNASFDVRMLKNMGVETDKDKVFCTCNYFKKDHSEGGHKLIDAVKYYCPQALRDFEGNAHDALSDTIAALRVYLAIQTRNEFGFDFKDLKDPIKGSDIAKIYKELNEPEKEVER